MSTLLPKVTVSNFVHEWNRNRLIYVTPSGSDIEGSDEQPKKADSPIDVRELGRETVVSDSQWTNA